jgi:hypothetical protein
MERKPFVMVDSFNGRSNRFFGKMAKHTRFSQTVSSFHGLPLPETGMSLAGYLRSIDKVQGDRSKAEPTSTRG